MVKYQVVIPGQPETTQGVKLPFDGDVSKIANDILNLARMDIIMSRDDT